MPKQTVNKKPAVKKPTAAKPKAKVTPKPKAKTTTKPAPKPKATTKPKPKPKPRTRTKPKTNTKPVGYIITNWEEEFPHDAFPWKLIHKEGNEKRSCYFQCEEHRKKHIARYKLKGNDIIFLGYKFDGQ